MGSESTPPPLPPLTVADKTPRARLLFQDADNALMMESEVQVVDRAAVTAKRALADGFPSGPKPLPKMEMLDAPDTGPLKRTETLGAGALWDTNMDKVQPRRPIPPADTRKAAPAERTPPFNTKLETVESDTQTVVAALVRPIRAQGDNMGPIWPPPPTPLPSAAPLEMIIKLTPPVAGRFVGRAEETKT